MEQKTTLSQSIDIVQQKAQYDEACKKVLAEKIILAWIMKHTMKEYVDHDVREIVEKFIVGEPKVAEVKVLPDETIFTKSHYEKIQKVYSVWICMNPPKERNNSITGYSLTEKNHVGKVKEKEENYDLMDVVMICLGKSEEEAESELLRLLDVLLSSDKKAKEKKVILENEFQIPMTEQMKAEVEYMCNLSDGVEQKGIEKGIEIGIKQGIEQKNRLVVINMLKEKEPIENICRYAQCDEEYVLQIKKELF